MAVSYLHIVLLCVSYLGLGHCQTAAPDPCSAYRTCDTCVPHAKCLWCFTSSNCTEYPVRWLLPPASLCPLSQARWGVCWMNFETLIIVLAVLCGIVLISIIVVCCCCCCCCCKRRSSRLHRDDESFSRRREEIRQRSEERKVERNARHDEIRKKYEGGGVIIVELEKVKYT